MSKEASEQSHQDDWYAEAIRQHFFDREGFRRLGAWNLAHFRRATRLTTEMHLLSVGCGTGGYELALAKEVASVSAFDLSAVAIDEARRRAREAGCTNLEFWHGSFQDMAFASSSFDVVFAFGVLHHLSHDERRAFLQAAASWLKPSGQIYVRDPNADGWLRKILGRWFQRRSTVHSPNEAALSPQVIVSEMVQAGFSIEEVSGVDVIGGPLPWLVKSPSPLFWALVFAFDRACLALPFRFRLSSQFAVSASKRLIATPPASEPRL